jgi:hypothetical protein
MSAQFKRTKPVCETAPVEVGESINKPESDVVLHPPNKPIGFKSKASS